MNRARDYLEAAAVIACLDVGLPYDAAMLERRERIAAALEPLLRRAAQEALHGGFLDQLSLELRL